MEAIPPSSGPGTDGAGTSGGPATDGADHVGPSPAPGSGHPATDTRLSRTAIVVIVVVGLLWLAGWIAWTILAPDIEVRYEDHPSRHDDGPNGRGRLTAAPGPTVA
ncbi:MAG: hypothetical protein R2691_03040 [Solirubrobacterales bacterium]